MPPITFTHDESGQTMTEYSVVVGVLVLGVIAAIGFFGAAVTNYFDAFLKGIS